MPTEIQFPKEDYDLLSVSQKRKVCKLINQLGGKSNTINIARYACLCVDMMGQSDALKTISAIPWNINNINDILNDTEIPVSIMYSSFEDGLREKPGQNQIPGSLESDDSAVRLFAFSDTCIMFTPLSHANRYLDILNIYNMIVAACYTMIATQSCGCYGRGGLAIGWGVEGSKIDFYGQVIYDAFMLEKNDAQYSRIAVHKNFIKDLRDYASRNNTTNLPGKCDLESERLINKISELIYTDKYGIAAIDYLGKASIETLKYTYDPPERARGGDDDQCHVNRGDINMVLEKAIENYKECEKGKKIMEKYCKLCYYILSRINQWDQAFNAAPNE